MGKLNQLRTSPKKSIRVDLGIGQSLNNIVDLDKIQLTCLTRNIVLKTFFFFFFPYLK